MGNLPRQLVGLGSNMYSYKLSNIPRDRTNPVGYKLSVIPFQNGEPVAVSNNNSAATDIFSNADNSKCPQNCFRPVGIAFDSQGRLFVSSDATGEIYVVQKNQASPGASGTNPSSSPSATSSSKSGAGKPGRHSFDALIIVFVVFCMIF